MDKMKLPRLAYNWLSTLGALLAVLTFILIVIVFAVSMLSDLSSPYIGILLYMILPAFLILGLLIIPIGMYRQWRHLQKYGELPVQKWPHVDLNNKKHRNATFIFVGGTILFILVSSVGTYQAYHYSESVSFCGTTCHVLMEPEYTAYQNSPHARVACTSCHVGPGAGWYTRSKLSGAYQVYSTIFHKYPKPIPTPVRNLRPAQQTCEQCHWPAKFYGGQQKQFYHFMYDSSNTSWPINMLIKTGGGDPSFSQAEGIHWHMNIGYTVEYIPRDEKRQDIPWMKITEKKTGVSTIFQDVNDPLSAEEIAKATPRTMDCIDCHNRPSHNYRSPDYAIDQQLLIGRLNGKIPEIKKIAVEAMAKEYGSKDEARTNIAGTIKEFYKTSYPDYFQSHNSTIDSAITAVQDAFFNNIFPDMKVRWSFYPVNIGHFTNKGCMRCHDGNHASEDGKIVNNNCNSCHIIMSQGSGERARFSNSAAGLEFEHPVDIADAWKETGCYECHSGVQP
jgi:nitrate/TMAO reductase-like tetraheme cytochrome c subunit